MTRMDVKAIETGVHERSHSAEVIHIGWFSPWNSRTRIAEYSKNLLNSFDNKRAQWTILASSKDIPIGPDSDQVIRCWSNSTGRITPLLDVLENKRFDTLIVQFHLDFLSPKQLGTVVACCHAIGTKLVIICHDLEAVADAPENALSNMVVDLTTVDSILVHSNADIERLKKFGLSDNVRLLPYGHIEPTLIDRRVARKAWTAARRSVEASELAPGATDGRQLGRLTHERKILRDLKQAMIQKKWQLPDDALIVGSYGFFLPHKGIDNLIPAIASLRSLHVPAKLLLVNALHPHPASGEYLARCQALAAECGIVEHVIFESDFLPDEVSVARLAACDVLVFPYKSPIGSSSAAVRMGLASRRPVICSPQPIFADLANAVVFLEGACPKNIAHGIRTLLSDNDGLARLARHQERWLERNSWPDVARQLQDIVTSPVARESIMTRHQTTTRFVAALVAEREASEDEVRVLRDQFAWLHTQIEAAQQREAAAAKREQGLAVSVAQLELAVAQLELAKGDLGEMLGRAKRDLTAALTKIDELNELTNQWRAVAESRYIELQSMFASRSWSLTKPLRRIGALRHRPGVLQAAWRMLRRRQ